MNQPQNQNTPADGQSRAGEAGANLTDVLAAETARAEQLAKNCMWLIAKIDRIHAALCKGENGSWQMRAEQTVNAAERKAANVQI